MNQNVSVIRLEDTDGNEVEGVEVEPKDFGSKFLYFAQRAIQSGQKLFIEKYENFIKNVTLLRRLKEVPNFEVGDFPELKNSEHLDVLIAHLELVQSGRGRRVVNTLGRPYFRSNTAATVGNPNIEDAIKKAARSRKRNAIYDDRNIEAGKRIIALSNNKENTLQSIADTLNAEKYTTSRGGKFHPRSVDRLKKRYQAILARFDCQDKILLESANNFQTSCDLEIFDFENEQNFDKSLSFQILHSNLATFHFEVLDNQGQLVESLKDGLLMDYIEDSTFRYNLEDQTALLPGLYFIRIYQGATTCFLGYFNVSVDIKERLNNV